MSTCSQKTITLASNSALSGMRHALSVPQSAAPRPTSHGPYGAPVELGLAILKRLPSAVCRINADDFILDYENGSNADFSRFLECVIIQTRLESRPSKDRKSTIRRLCRDYRRFLRRVIYRLGNSWKAAKYVDDKPSFRNRRCDLW